jgi:TRAP-type C4-dicarboxylate transport system substrate-binding protein
MGANSVAMGVSEVYSGMQTGVIDGAENNPPTFIAHNYMPVAKNYTLSGHFITPEMLLYSKVKWDKLSADDQKKSSPWRVKPSSNSANSGKPIPSRRWIK